eukprot:CAMPEP_0176165350 /NCGR_PEP_ID=MMETSP0120_2-20121206/84575_1 /TAXON_ID=160619 /ORGANISM="Kryptoperidinium foliaceum, Strain CCMP 1326" /LENGTH=181 /DNA_ID=CAMNT_0017502883 /DNA_START=112 /DNA_END=653 /DNA_ORIENTATION=-
MAAQIDQALVDALGEPGARNCLDLCGLTADAQKEGWIAEGMTDMEAILSSRQGTGNLRKVKALVRWWLERRSQRLSLDSREFTQDELQRMVERVRIEEDEEDAGIEPIKISVKFKPTKWVQWKLGFQTYLCQMRGLQQVPLTYVIRSQTLPPNLLTRIVEEIRLYTIALEGPLYQSDNRNV